MLFLQEQKNSHEKITIFRGALNLSQWFECAVCYVTTGDLILLLVAGLFGGALNAVVGGATFFTFPALISVGLPPIVANATNFLTLLPASATASIAYRDELYSLGKSSIRLVFISAIGAMIGALLLLQTDEARFINLIPYLILFATLLYALNEHVHRLLIVLFGSSKCATRITPIVLLFFASIYGGYFGAGASVVILAALHIYGIANFHTANGLKNLIATGLTILSLVVFGIGGVLALPHAFTMMAGSIVGGYAGASLGRKVKQKYLKKIVIFMGLSMSIYYFIVSKQVYD